MAELPQIYMGAPMHLLPFGDDAITLYQQFCEEQPNIVAFIDKHSCAFSKPVAWTHLLMSGACQVWWTFVGNLFAIPPVARKRLTALFIENERFVAANVAKRRDRTMKRLTKPIATRSQPTLRSLMMASIFERTQIGRIHPTDGRKEPDLVRNQNHAHVLIGTVIDAIDEIALMRPAVCEM